MQQDSSHGICENVVDEIVGRPVLVLGIPAAADSGVLTDVICSSVLPFFFKLLIKIQEQHANIDNTKINSNATSKRPSDAQDCVSKSKTGLDSSETYRGLEVSGKRRFKIGNGVFALRTGLSSLTGFSWRTGSS